MSTPVFFAPLNFAEMFSRRARALLKGTHDVYQIKDLWDESNYVSYLYVALFYKKLKWVRKFQFIDFCEIFKTAGGTWEINDKH